MKSVATTILLLLTAFAATAMAGERLEVALHSEVYISSRFIRVSDVAKLDCDKAATLKRASTVTLGRLPKAETAKTIKSERIRERLMLAGIPSADFKIVGTIVKVFNKKIVTNGVDVLAKSADTAKSEVKVAVKAEPSKANVEKAAPVKTAVKKTPKASDKITQKRILELARDLIAAEVAQATEIPVERISVETFTVNQPLRLLGSGDLHLSACERTSKGSPLGRIPYKLTIERNGVVKENYTYTVLIKQRLKIYLAKRDIKARERITAESVFVEEVLFDTKVVGNYATSLDQLLNFAPKYMLRGGEKVDITKLEKAVIVKRGARVKLIPAGKAGKFFGKSYAFASANGAEGEYIYVEYDAPGSTAAKPKKIKIQVIVTGVNEVKALLTNKRD